MKDTCPGSGKRPKRIDSAGFGECSGCPSTRRLRKDGRMRVHKPSEDLTFILKSFGPFLRRQR